MCVSRTHLYALLVILDFRIKFDTIIDVLCLANTDMENMDYSGEGIDCLKCLWFCSCHPIFQSVHMCLCSFLQSPSSQVAISVFVCACVKSTEI